MQYALYHTINIKMYNVHNVIVIHYDMLYVSLSTGNTLKPKILKPIDAQ